MNDKGKAIPGATAAGYRWAAPATAPRIVLHRPPPLAPARGVAQPKLAARPPRRPGAPPPPVVAPPRRVAQPSGLSVRAIQRTAVSTPAASATKTSDSAAAESIAAAAATIATSTAATTAAADPHSEAIWKWLCKGGKSAAFSDGRIEIQYVPVDHEASNCHHFAFSNFTGSGDLATIVGAEVYQAMSVYFDFPETLALAASQPAQTICLMGKGPPAVDHSARQEIDGGLWWNKFVGLPYVLGFASVADCCTAFGYTDTELIAVTLPRGNYDTSTQKRLWRRPG